MKALKIILTGVSLLGLAFTLICGLYIRAKGFPTNAASLRFHLMLAQGSVLLTVATFLQPGKLLRIVRPST
jgi:hypothetical protein